MTATLPTVPRPPSIILSFCLKVHVASLAADVGFVHFDWSTFAAHLHQGTALHCQAESLKHEPCGLLGDTKGAVDFVRTNSVLAIWQPSNKATSHLSKPIGESSKIVPTLTLNCFRGCLALHSHMRRVEIKRMSLLPQVGHTTPLFHRCATIRFKHLSASAK